VNIFEQGTRKGLRFSTDRGQLTIEDLWDLPLTGRTSNSNLDDIARGLHKQIKASADEVSFVAPTTGQGTNEELQLKFDVVKHIIDVRVAERDAAKEAAARREQKQRLLEIIDRKQGQALEGKSLEELTAMVNSL
jgi:hypothetical protein